MTKWRMVVSEIRGNTLRAAEGTPVHLPDDMKISNNTFIDLISAQKEIERLRKILVDHGIDPDGECIALCG